MKLGRVFSSPLVEDIVDIIPLRTASLAVSLIQVELRDVCATISNVNSSAIDLLMIHLSYS